MLCSAHHSLNSVKDSTGELIASILLSLKHCFFLYFTVLYCTAFYFTLLNCTVSVLGQEEGITVKYTPLPIYLSIFSYIFMGSRYHDGWLQSYFATMNQLYISWLIPHSFAIKALSFPNRQWCITPLGPILWFFFSLLGLAS